MNSRFLVVVLSNRDDITCDCISCVFELFLLSMDRYSSCVVFATVVLSVVFSSYYVDVVACNLCVMFVVAFRCNV